MKKLFLITLILLFQSFPSYGEWKEVNSDSEGVYFIEVDTVRKNGDLIYFNELNDFYGPSSTFDNSLSQIRRLVVNCKTKEIKQLRNIYYLNSMGKGKIVYEFNHPLSWSHFDKGSLTYSYYKFLC